MTAPILSVSNLSVTTTAGQRIVEDLSLDLAQGEILGLVGESGSGKTVACRAIIRLLPQGAMQISGGRVVLKGRDLTSLSETGMQKVRGGEIGMIFQNPTAHLDPVMRIGAQIAEAVRLHEGVSRREARLRAI